MARTIQQATEGLTSSATCLPCEQKMALDDDDLDLSPLGEKATWAGAIVLEGVMTGDGRLIEDNALRWATLPVPIRYVSEDNGAHDGAEVVGHIYTIERQPGGVIWGTGDFDLDSDVGREAARHVGKKITNGISVDLDEVSFQIRIAKDLLEDQAVSAEEAEEEKAEDLQGPVDDEGRVTVMDIDAGDEVMVTDDARIRAATIVAIPAFEQARIFLDDSVEIPDDGTVVAGAFGQGPPVEWFQNPGLTEPTRLTVTEDGRVYGHLATWGTCHTGYHGQCITPPHSSSGYGYFRTGTVRASNDSEIATGVITLDTLHAGKDLSAADTLAHYENTGHGVCDVAAGEDEHGIWIAGALRPGVGDDQVRVLRASPLSGDWRRIGGKLELVAALAVNVPGFPIPRPQGMVAGGSMTSLVASGILPPEMVVTPGQPGALSISDLKYLKQIAERERQAATSDVEDEVASMARQLRAESLAKQVNEGI